MISGLAIGMETTALPVVAISIALIGSFWAGAQTAPTLGVSAHIAGIYGTAVATMGMLMTAAYILAMDTFGPIADNAGGHYMQHGEVDLCIVGTDRTTASGDVANKIGTYLKALAAHDNGVPFYVALPSSTIDWTISDGVKQIEIEERSGREITHVQGRTASGDVLTVELTAPGSPARNPAFDVTPARLVTGLITERGVAPATRAGLAKLFPERGS